MAGRSTRRPVTEINPAFFIPEDVDELVYSDINISLEGDEVVDDGGAGEIDVPDTPTINGVISQTVHKDKAGHDVVDVVFDVSDVAGADSYEIRVSKA